MKLLFSIPTGYHLRELVLPLRSYLEQDSAITQVVIVTPAAPYAQQLFPGFSSKFIFIENPSTLEAHSIIMQKFNPDLVITNTVGHDERDYPILVSAKQAGCKTLTFIASWDNVWKIERLLKTPNRVALADTFIVWNTMMKEHLARIFPNLSLSNIHIIGAPRFDFYSQTDKIPNKEQLFQKLGLKDASRPLIHFSTTELYPMDYIAKAVKQAMDKGKLPKNLALLATVHPGGNLDKHATLEQFGCTVRFAFGRKEDTSVTGFSYNPSEQDLYDAVALYKHTAILINHSSTTALESLLANVPVINVKYGQPFDWWRWYRSMVYRDFQQHYADVVSDGATKVVAGKKQLIKAMQTYLKNPQTDESARAITIKKMITTVDGTASAQVMELIKQKATSL